jgi:carbon-monoxide dehydrogenase medium subunit
MIREFALHRPTSVDDACTMLERGADDATVYAGGTELLLVLKLGLAHYAHLVDIKPLGLDRVAYDGTMRILHIGATATHRQVERSPAVRRHCPILAEVAHSIGNIRVRATGTVGGNLCFAEPHSDVGALVVLLDGRLHVAGAGRRRTVEAGAFLLDEFTNGLDAGEMLEGIDVPITPRCAMAYQKYGMLERPSVSAGCCVQVAEDRQTVEGARSVVGCVGPVPILVGDAAAILRDAPLDPRCFGDLAGEAGLAARQACEPMSDLHGSAEYKRQITEVLVARTVSTSLERAGELVRGA